MKKLLLILLLLPSLAWGAETQEYARMNPYILGGGASAAAGCGGGTSYLVCENFDGSTACGDGSHTNCDVEWTGFGTTPVFDFNYSTSPAPLEGTYSAKTMDADDVNTGYVVSFTESDAIHFFYMINAHKRSAGGDQIRILAADGTQLMDVSNAGYEFAIHCGTVLDYSTAMDVDTTYYVWGDYTKGDGVNTAVCNLYHSTNSTKGSADCTITNGDAAAKKAGKIALYHPSTTTNDDYIFDKIRVSTSSIGDNPN